MKKIGVFILCLFWMGCSFQQDPLAEYPENIREGQPVKKPTDDKPANAPIIDINDSYTVQETGTLKFSISARVFQPDVKWKILVENISEFHGASFDASTGEFTWSPPVGTAVGIEPKAKTLHVTIVLDTKPIYAVTKDVSIFVIRKTQAPVIETVENLPDKQIVYEGRTHSFNVKVRMPAQDEMPTLIAPATVTGTGNASGLVSFVRLQPVVSPQDPTLWVFSMRLQTQDIDLTDSKMSMEFGLQAFSPYGEASAIVEKEFMLYTSLMKPMITWRTDGRFTTDQLNKVEFMIFDPRSEGKLDIQNNCLNVLGAGASCYCVGSDSAKNCAVEWLPDATKGSRTYTIEFRAKNESPNARDPRFSEEVFRKKIFVETKIATEVAK